MQSRAVPPSGHVYSDRRPHVFTQHSQNRSLASCGHGEKRVWCCPGSEGVFQKLNGIVADRDAPCVNTGNTVVSEWSETQEVVWFLFYTKRL